MIFYSEPITADNGMVIAGEVGMLTSGVGSGRWRSQVRVDGVVMVTSHHETREDANRFIIEMTDAYLQTHSVMA